MIQDILLVIGSHLAICAVILWTGQKILRAAEVRSLKLQAQLRVVLVELVDAIPEPETADQRAALQHARRVLAYNKAEA